MSSHSSISAPAAPLTTPLDRGVSTEAADFSCRAAVPYLLTSALVWLSVSLVLSLLSLMKLHAPGLLAGTPLLTYGRLVPAANNAFLFGFASQAAFGITLWMMARLGRTTLFAPRMAGVAALFWNAGVTIAVVWILAGWSTGYERFDLPRSASIILLFSYFLIGLSAVMTFIHRRKEEAYPSTWFLIAALFWFPWVLLTGMYFIHFHTPRGIVQNIVATWAGNGLVNLWLAPVAFAVVLYFGPKLSARPLHSRANVLICFWLWAIFAGFVGFEHTVALPRWMRSLSVAMMVLLAIPAAGLAATYFATRNAANRQKSNRSPVLGAMTFSVLCLLVAGGSSALCALPPLNQIVGFTYATVGFAQLFLFGFIGISFMAAIYYIYPAIFGYDLAATGDKPTYLRLSILGVLLLAVPMILAGFIQGRVNAEAATPFINGVRATLPFIGISMIGLLLLLVAQLYLFYKLSRGALDYGLCAFRQCCAPAQSGTPTVPRPVVAGKGGRR